MNTDFFVVGIGYSAGGLDPLKTFFRHLPSEVDLAFIVAHHIHREHQSRLKEILSYLTPIPVEYIRDNMRIQPNRIYALQTNYYAKVKNDHLHLVKRGEELIINVAINTLFESLAEDKKEKAIGIILSGGGSDGAKGCYAIAQHGGQVLIQAPSSADFQYMPKNAIREDHPTAIERPEELARILVERTRNINHEGGRKSDYS